MKCIIIGAGSFKNNKIIKQQNDYLICADAGYIYAQQNNLETDLIVGDFDSIDIIPNNIKTIKLNKEKDETDLFVALQEGIKLGFKDFYIYGAIGGRIEHTYANIQILAYLNSVNLNGTLINDQTEIKLLKVGTYIYESSYNGYISLFSYSDESKITIKNLKYELDNKIIKNSFPLGIDNEFIGLDSEIIIHQGLVLSIISKNNEKE